MARKLSLDLDKVTDDTRILARAVAVANIEGQVAAEDLRSDLSSMVWAAEALLDSARELQRNSEELWEKEAQNRRYEEMVARRTARENSDG